MLRAMGVGYKVRRFTLAGFILLGIATRNREVPADRDKGPFCFSILEAKAHSLVCSLNPPVNLACPCNAGRLCTQLI
jgi:hypothetical protein